MQGRTPTSGWAGLAYGKKGINKEGSMAYNEIMLAAWLCDLAERDEGLAVSIKDCFPGEVSPDEVLRLIANYRKPSSPDELIVAQADALSSGSCGVNGGNKAPSLDKALVHLPSVLEIDKRRAAPAFCSPAPLEWDKIMPSREKTFKKEQYLELLAQFKKDFKALKGKPCAEYMPALDTMMEHYFWCVSSSSGDASDVSLYQHAKLTAAFAGALFRLGGDTKFLFINGDMSGIQKYIFDLKTTSENAKLLRARSFQLWALSEIIANDLTSQFRVSSENIISSAGGKFLVLVPDVSESDKLIQDFRLKWEKWFLHEFAGRLSFILSDGVSASPEDLQVGHVQDLLNKIGTASEWAKQRKMQAVLEEEGPALDSLYSKLQMYGECDYCGILPKKNDTSDKCQNCEDLIRIGGNLLRANKIVFHVPGDNPPSFDDMVKIKKDDNAFGYVINDYKAGSPLIYLPYIAPWEDEHYGIPKLFEDIAKRDKGEQGTEKLAMFKADVDNLGLVFSSSLGEAVSLARYAALSRLLHYFFSGWYYHFVNNNPNYRENIYTVFSGGDDLCVLGSWDTVLHFAAEFRKEFAKFVNNNPSLTLSGGIALASPTLPVRNIAEEAEAALETAKKREDVGKIIKNAISVFNTTVSWDEYDTCLADAKQIIGYLNNGSLASGVVYKMLDFANRAENVKNGNLRDMVWKSNFVYTIARNVKNNEIKKFFSGFGTEEKIEKSRIAVCYALYSRRS
jgi:CRISPR-associated protein Csm1